VPERSLCLGSHCIAARLLVCSVATCVPQYIRNSRGGAVLRTHVAEIPLDSISPTSAALGAGTVAVQQNNQQTVPRRSLCPVMVVFFFLRLVLRFRRSLSRQISTPCCGGSRAQCRWYLFAETSAAITEKSQKKNHQQCRGGPRAR